MLELCKTARTSGAIGPNAIVPRFILEHFKPPLCVLDFGAGPEAKHSALLRGHGFSVNAWELTGNFNPSVHEPFALACTYDIVMLSNILNVQKNIKDIREILRTCWLLLRTGGSLVFNYPKSPRKTEKEILFLMMDTSVVEYSSGLFEVVKS